jgi:ubiquinone/menaquinone biosynthesis C-methylase UbiE
MSQSNYIWGTNSDEQRRLSEQVELYRSEASSLLDQLQIPTGSRAIDLGCGPLGILDLLAESVGPQGEVFGVEREARFVEVARDLLADRRLDNVQIIQGDATKTNFPGESFDIAHERLLLIVVPEPQKVIGEMIRLVKPGGIVALEDVDNCSWVCDPPHPAWPKLYKTFETLYRQEGKDPNIGRRLPRLLNEAGLENVGYKAHTRFNKPSDFHQHQLLHFINLYRERITKLDLLSDQELLDLYEQLSAHLADPATIVISPLLVQAWGYKRR